MESYRGFFSFPDQGFIDPHLRFQKLLKLQNGVGGARETYHAMKEASPNPVTRFAWMLLLPREARIENLEQVLTKHEDFAPAAYELSRDYSVARLGTQTLSDKRNEKRYLTRFVELKDAAGFLRHYLDQSVAAQQVEDATERLAALSAVAERVLENPVSLSAMRSNASWMVTLNVAELTKELFVRVNDGAFKSTGHLPNMHPTTGLPMPRPFFELPLTASKTAIEVKYTDPKGKEHGPYALVFDPAVEAVKSVKNVLQMTKSSWVSFRDWDGRLLLYFTHLLSSRSALSKIAYGLDTDVPDRDFPFTPADPRNPHAIDTDATIYISVPKTTKYVTVRVTYADGTTSEVNRIER